MSDVHLSVDMEGDDLDLVALSGMTSDFRKVLEAIESTLTNGPAKATWHVEDVTGFQVVASPNGVTHETLQKVVERAYEGFRRAGEAGDAPVNWPPEINRAAQRAILGIFSQLSRIDKITIEGAGFEPLTLARQDTNPPREHAGRGYHEISELDGKLEMISVRGRPLFVIAEHGTGVRVPCRIPDGTLEQFLNAIGKRVVVEGVIRYNAEDVPTSMTGMTDFFVRPRPLQTLEELVGSVPDFTGGIDPVEYVRAMREPDDA